MSFHWLSLVFPRLSLSETVHGQESGLISIPALWFQVKAYQNVGIVSHCLIEKNNTRLAEKKFKAVIEVVVERRKLYLLYISVMHTKNEYTKSQGQESRENETTWESPYLLAPSSGYNNWISIVPDSRTCQSLKSESLGETRLISTVKCNYNLNSEILFVCLPAVKTFCYSTRNWPTSQTKPVEKFTVKRRKP